MTHEETIIMLITLLLRKIARYKIAPIMALSFILLACGQSGSLYHPSEAEGASKKPPATKKTELLPDPLKTKSTKSSSHSTEKKGP